MKLFANLDFYGLKYYRKNNYKVKIMAALAVNEDKTINIFNENAEEWIKEIIQLKDSCKIYIHNSGSKGLRFILSLLSESFNTKNITTLAKTDGDLIKVSLRHKLRIGKSVKTITLTFLDISLLWPFTIQEMGKSLGQEVTYNEKYDIEFIENYINSNRYIELSRDLNILVDYYNSIKHIKDLDDYKLTISSTSYKEMFILNPSLKYDICGHLTVEEWDLFKKAHKGGFVWLNPIYQLKELYKIKVYDINSMYPYLLKNNKFPFGKVYYNGEGTFKLYEVDIKYAKAKYVPFMAKDSLSDTVMYEKELKDCTRYMSNYMLEHFNKYYEGEWKETYLCSQYEKYGMFDQYYDKYMKGKLDAVGTVRDLYKLFLNTPTGTLAKAIKKITTKVFFKSEVEHMFNKDLRYEYDVKDNNGKVKSTRKAYVWRNDVWNGREYHYDELYYCDEQNITHKAIVSGNLIFVKTSGEYVDKFSMSPISIAVKLTELARINLTTVIIKNWDLEKDESRVVYCDTDSVHILGDVVGIDIDDKLYGYWKYEGNWDKAIYRMPKHYYLYNSDTDYKLRGSGYSVDKFNPTNLPLSEYIKPILKLEKARRRILVVDGGTITIERDFNLGGKDEE